MGYNNLRLTVSKKESECNVCSQTIHKGENIYIIPGKYIAHIKCHNKSNATS